MLNYVLVFAAGVYVGMLVICAFVTSRGPRL